MADQQFGGSIPVDLDPIFTIISARKAAKRQRRRYEQIKDDTRRLD